MEFLGKALAEKAKKRRSKNALHKEKLKEELKSLAEHGKREKKHPSHLKGAQIGLWYRNQQKSKNKEDDKKKDKIGLSDNVYKLKLAKYLEDRIKSYLDSVENVPPPSLAAQVRVLESDSLEKLSSTTSNESKNKVSERNYSKRNSNDTVAGTDDELSIDNQDAINYWTWEWSLDNEVEEEEDDDGYDTITNKIKNTDSSAFLSMADKYKHLEDTPFKKKFMHTLTGTIEENLERRLHKFKLVDNKQFNNEIRNNFLSKKQGGQYRRFLAKRKELPSFKMRAEILKTINKNQVVLITGDTGCGKTTQIAQYILDDEIENGRASLCSIVCTQPRRISAISVAHRVAQERNEQLGRESIGYHVRLEKNIGRTYGSILYCTTGMLIQYMQTDPALSKYSHIILDEIHERDTICDFALTIIRDIILKRKDLKVILMSATMNAERFSQYFNNCPIVHIPGQTYPVTEYYLEDVLNFTRYVPDLKKVKKKKIDEEYAAFVLPYINEIEKKKAYHPLVIETLKNPDSEKIDNYLIVELIQHICNYERTQGAILIFLPGWDDINSLMKMINSDPYFSSGKYWILPLHSMLPTIDQQNVFDRPPTGTRKIIISTNIAETSVTIDDVVFVIDSGRAKVKNFDISANLSTLTPEWISRANAKQRCGRAGRVQPGVCYHLFSRGRERNLLPFPVPDMLRTRLEEVVLNVKILQLGITIPFLNKVMDPPNEAAVRLAVELLTKLSALDENEYLTPLGYHLARLPLDPHIGKMLLLGAIMSCLDPILDIASVLSFKDPFYCPPDREKDLNEKKLQLANSHKSDHLLFVEMMRCWQESEKKHSGKQFCSAHFINRNNMFKIRDLKSQFARYLLELGFIHTTNYRDSSLNINSHNFSVIKAVICSGLYPNVAVIRKKFKICGGKRNRLLLYTAEDGKVSLHPKSLNNLYPSDDLGSFLVYHEKMKSSNVFIYDSTVVNAIPMLLFGSGFKLKMRSGETIMNLKRDLNFLCSPNLSNLITELKIRLDWLLEYRLSHPGQIKWFHNNNSEHKLLKILIELLEYEDNNLDYTLNGTDNEKEDDDDDDEEEEEDQWYDDDDEDEE